MTFSKHSLQFYSDFHQYQNWQGTEAFYVVNRSVKSVHCELFLMLLSNSRNLRWNSHYFVWKWPNNVSNMIWFKAFFLLLYCMKYTLFWFPAQHKKISNICSGVVVNVRFQKSVMKFSKNTYNAQNICFPPTGQKNDSL